ncbi:unnamed protein product, partial [Timema podura]|nr:unnamed protein product [Timema podura]
KEGCSSRNPTSGELLERTVADKFKLTEKGCILFTTSRLILSVDKLDAVGSWLNIDFSSCETNVDEVETPGKKRIRKPISGVSARAVDEFTRDSISQFIHNLRTVCYTRTSYQIKPGSKVGPQGVV